MTVLKLARNKFPEDRSATNRTVPACSPEVHDKDDIVPVTIRKIKTTHLGFQRL